MWPVLIEWNGTTVFSYPLFIGLAWGLGYRLCEMKLPEGMSARGFVLWFCGLFLSSWVGAKVLFMTTQDQFAVVDLATASSFWLGGGFVFLGGFLGSLLFTAVVSFFSVQFKLSKMQFTIIPLLWSHAVGRVGCLLAGCCFGTATDLPWGIHLHGLHRHPVQIYEAVALSLLAFSLSRWSQKTSSFLAYYLIGYGSIRWTLELLRGDEIRGAAWLMSTSQWLSLGMLFIGLFLYFRRLGPQIQPR